MAKAHAQRYCRTLQHDGFITFAVIANINNVEELHEYSSPFKYDEELFRFLKFKMGSSFTEDSMIVEYILRPVMIKMREDNLMGKISDLYTDCVRTENLVRSLLG